MNNMQQRISRISVFVVLLAVLMARGRTASAQVPPYFVQFSYPGGAACTANGFSIPDHIAFYVPPTGARFFEVDVLNGQPVYQQHGTTAYTGEGIYDSPETDAKGFPARLPYTYSVTYVFADDTGKAFNTSSITLVCDGPPTVSIGNGQPATDLNGDALTDHPYVTFAYPGGGNCSTTGFNIPELINYNLRASGAHYMEYDSINGRTIYNFEGTATYAGSTQHHFVSAETDAAGFPASLPYTYLSTYDFSVNGAIVSSNTVTVMCGADGRVTVAMHNGPDTWLDPRANR